MSQPGFTRSNEAEQQWLPPQPTSRPIWPWITLLAGVVLILLLRWRLTTGDGGSGRDGQVETVVGTNLTKLDLQPLTGNPPPVSLADLEGKVTLINFWGPWCGYCIVEFPHLVELEQHFRSEPEFQFLSVSSNPDPSDEQGLAENTAEFMKQRQAEFPTYRDPGGHSTRALVETSQLAGFGYPTTILVDRDVIIRGVWIGFRPGDEKGMRQAIENVLRRSSADTNPLPARAGSGAK